MSSHYIFVCSPQYWKGLKAIKITARVEFLLHSIANDLKAETLWCLTLELDFIKSLF